MYPYLPLNHLHYINHSDIFHQKAMLKQQQMAKILTFHSVCEKAERNGNTRPHFILWRPISKAQRQTKRIILRYENNNNNIDMITVLREQKKALLRFVVSVVPVPNIRFPTFTYANMGMYWKSSTNERWMKLFTCDSVDSRIFSLHSIPISPTQISLAFFFSERHNTRAFILFHLIFFLHHFIHITFFYLYKFEHFSFCAHSTYTHIQMASLSVGCMCVCVCVCCACAQFLFTFHYTFMLILKSINRALTV